MAEPRICYHRCSQKQLTALTETTGEKGAFVPLKEFVLILKGKVGIYHRQTIGHVSIIAAP